MKKLISIKLDQEEIDRIKKLIETIEPKTSQNAIIEYCLERGLPELEKKYEREP